MAKKAKVRAKGQANREGEKLGDRGVPVDGASATFPLNYNEIAYLGSGLLYDRVGYRIWVTSGRVYVLDFEGYAGAPYILNAGTYVDLIKQPGTPIKLEGQDEIPSTVRVALVGFPPIPRG